MEKSDIDDRNSKWVKVEVPTVQLPTTVSLVLLQPVRLIAVGSVTGKEYIWDNAGSIVEVDNQDAEELLAKNLKVCQSCSGFEFSPYFEKLER